MPRRRMIDPGFWTDRRMSKASRDERLMFIGMINHADDEGRLLGDPAYLRSTIFPYEDFTVEEARAMRDHLLQINPNLILYQNAGEEYLYFRKWRRYQKPSHPQPSILPTPPPFTEPFQEPFTEPFQEPFTEQNQNEDGTIPGTIPSQVRLGKVRLGKDSVGDIPGIDPGIDQDLVLLGEALERLSGELPSGTDGEWMSDLKKEFEVAFIIGNMEKAVEVTKHWPGWKYIETMCRRGKSKARDRPGKLPTGEELKESWGDVARRSDAKIKRLIEEGKIEDFRARDSPDS